MGDDDRRPAAHHGLVAVDDPALRFGVERRRRLVEHQDRRVRQKRARDRDPLPLAGRQRRAALADDRLEPLRQPFDEGVERGPPRGFAHLGVGDASGRA